MIYICECCGKEIEKIIETDDGYELCEECYENQTITCSCCEGVYYNINYFTKTINGEEICENCYEREYFTCSCCDEVYHNNDGCYETDDGIVCTSCYNEYYYECDHCGDVVYRSNIYWTEDNYCLCEDCWEEYTYEDENGEYWYSPDNIPIKNYNYKPSPKFQGEGPLYFGVELEVGEILDDYSRKSLAKTLLNEIGECIYIKDDGSLENGFEIVTHPMTFNFIKNSQLFEKIEKILYKKARAYNKGGMHVHISRNSFLNNTHLQNFVKFINIYQNFSSFIAQRKSNSWAKFYCPADLNKVNLNTNYNPGGSDRYMSINFENSHTIEVRIFNANILTNRNYKNVEFLHALFEFSKNNTPDIAKFLAFIGANKKSYSNLLFFIKERKKSFLKSLKINFITWQEKFKILAKFLREKKVYSYFIEIADKKLLIKTLKYTPEEALNYTIGWNETIQGHKFWSNLHEEWKKYYKEATNA